MKDIQIFVGQTRARALIGILSALGYGEMTVRGDCLPPRRKPFVVDNGAYKDWVAQRPFAGDEYLAFLERVDALKERAQFLVVPDIVAAGERSLDFSDSWLPRVRGVAPLYLAVQDGMSGELVASALPRYDGLFVGGTKEWKIRTGAFWCDLAHRAGKRCHVGRVGTMRRVRWARRAGADSIDSNHILFEVARVQKLEGVLRDPQLELSIPQLLDPPEAA